MRSNRIRRATTRRTMAAPRLSPFVTGGFAPVAREVAGEECTVKEGALPVDFALKLTPSTKVDSFISVWRMS